MTFLRKWIFFFFHFCVVTWCTSNNIPESTAWIDLKRKQYIFWMCIFLAGTKLSIFINIYRGLKKWDCQSLVKTFKNTWFYIFLIKIVTFLPVIARHMIEKYSWLFVSRWSNEESFVPRRKQRSKFEPPVIKNNHVFFVETCILFWKKKSQR